MMLLVFCVGLMLPAAFGRQNQQTTVSPCAGMKGICYYNSSARYHAEPGKFTPQDLLTSVCTHMIYCCARISNNKLIPGDPKDLMLYKQFNARKLAEPERKTFLAVGGHDFPVQAMTSMLSTSDTRWIFIRSVIELLRKYKFDGLDLHCDVVKFKDRKSFTFLIMELNVAFYEETDVDNEMLLLIVSVCANVDKITCDVTMIHKYVEFVHLKAYAYHSSDESLTALNAPLFQGSTDQGLNIKLNIDYSAKHMISLGIPKNKLIIGMSTNGLGYTLANPKENNLNAPAIEPSIPVLYSNESGFLSYSEVCMFFLRNSRTKTVWLNEQKVSYLYFENQWVSYDDERSLGAKMDWLKTNGYGGWAAWDLSLVDFHGNECSRAPNPLLSALENVCHRIVAHPFILSKILYSTTAKPLELTTTKSTITLATSPMIEEEHITITSSATASDKTTDVLHLKCVDDGLYAHPRNCEQYVICERGEATVVTCNNNLNFDTERNECADVSSLTPARRSECGLST